jgi:hypothetical protein
MVDVEMNPMPPKVIGRKACLWVKSLYRLSKDHRIKSAQTLERRMSKKNKGL